jgi:hypothetical protein
MPTQIPVQPRASWMAETAAILIFSLLAAVIISAFGLAIAWAYTIF